MPCVPMTRRAVPGRGKEAITAVILERGSGMLAVFGGGSLLALFQPNLPLSIALLAHGLFIGLLVGLFLPLAGLYRRIARLDRRPCHQPPVSRDD